MHGMIESCVLPQRDLCELAIQAHAGNWSAFWRVLRSTPQTFSLRPPLGEVLLQVIDWLLKLKMLSRVEQDHLLEFLSYSAVARAFFHAVDVVVPQFAAEHVL